MNSNRFCLASIILAFMGSATFSTAEMRSGGWTAVTRSGEKVEVCLNDSLGTEAVFLENGGRFRSLALDSIDFLFHRSTWEPSARTHLIALGTAALGVGVFLNNVPDQPDLTISSGLVYGLEFGAAMLLGAAVGYGVGYLIDQSVADVQRIDLTRATRLEKSDAIRNILTGAAP